FSSPPAAPSPGDGPSHPTPTPPRSPPGGWGRAGAAGEPPAGQAAGQPSPSTGHPFLPYALTRASSTRPVLLPSPVVLVVALGHPGLLAGLAGVGARPLEHAVPGDPVQPVGVWCIEVTPVQRPGLRQPVPVGLGHGRP